MKLLLDSYVAGVLIVAIRLALQMVYVLDSYNWDSRKLDIWFTFSLVSLLWPLFALKPHYLIDPDPLFDDYGIAKRMRELDRLRENPPICG